jgi:quinoprotein glucose dehydrogenase
VHVYDSATGKQISELPLGGATSGAPSMYELNGRQYLLVTATPSSTTTGPSGIVAYALPRRQESNQRREDDAR